MVDSRSSLIPVKRIGLVAHDPDVKALLRIAVVWNVPVACYIASADLLISSPLMVERYERQLPDYEKYIRRLEEKSDKWV
jgi:methylglyoxal synthase